MSAHDVYDVATFLSMIVLAGLGIVPLVWAVWTWRPEELPVVRVVTRVSETEGVVLSEVVEQPAHADVGVRLGVARNGDCTTRGRGAVPGLWLRRLLPAVTRASVNTWAVTGGAEAGGRPMTSGERGVTESGSDSRSAPPSECTGTSTHVATRESTSV